MTEERLAEITESQAKAKFWHDQIDQSDRHESDFRKRGVKITQKYRDDEGGDQRYAMLWANTQLNMAALIGQIPNPDVSRRWITDDAIIRDSAEVMQKSMAHPMDDPSTLASITSAVFEGSVPGRGVMRVRYHAEFETVETGRQEPALDEATGLPMIGPDGQPAMRPVMVENENGNLVPETEERKATEKVYLQRVYWQDYRESIGRCQDDVWWRGFRHYMSRDDLIEEFGEEKGKKIPLTVSSSKKNPVANSEVDGTAEGDTLPAAFGRAEVWEIWNKKDRTVIWIASGHDDVIKEEEPALQFEGFFDCADPLIFYGTTDNTIPIPEYAFYQELVVEIDELQKRIAGIVSALRVVGFYHSALKELGDLSKIRDGTFYPTDEQMMFAMSDGSSPGLERLITSLPIERWASIIPTLSARVDQLRQAVFEITGFSDLMRGQTRASETLGAQNLKAQFGSYRLLPKQRAVQQWIEKTYALCGEVVAEMFDGDTVTRMTGIGEPDSFETWIESQGGFPEDIPPEQAEQIQAEAEQSYQQYVAEEAEHFDQVMAFLRNHQMRSFRVNVELDELARPDRQAMQATQAEAMAQTTQFMQSLANVPAPVIPPMLAMYKSWVRNFKLGRDTEELIDEALDGYPQYVASMQQSQQEAQEKAEEMQQQQAAIGVQLEQMKIQSGIEIQAMKDQAAKDLEMLRAELQAAFGDAGGNDVQHHEDDGLDADTLIKVEGDLEKARMKDSGDTERTLIKEAAATEREIIKADVAARGQDKSEQGKIMDVGAVIAKEALRPEPRNGVER